MTDESAAAGAAAGDAPGAVGEHDEQFAAVVSVVEPGARLVGVRSFAGGLSFLMTVLEVEGADGHRSRLVVRQPRHPSAPRRSLSVGDEFALLVALHDRGLPVPMPRRYDDTGAIFDHPYCVLDYVDGAPLVVSDDPAATGRAFATALAAVHRVAATDAACAALTARTDAVGRLLAQVPEHLDASLGEGFLRACLAARWPPPEPDRTVLLHGDFWVGNLLWRHGRIVAVIDWEEACTGDPLVDVATTRLDLLWAFGPLSMTAFTDHYFSLTGGDRWATAGDRSAEADDVAGLALWDLVAGLRPAGAFSSWVADWADFGRPDMSATTMRARHRWFCDAALTALGLTPPPD